MEKDFEKFEKKIGINFSDKDLLKQAFIHRSFINENSKIGMWHNERLEFLGDAVLELVTTEALFKKYKDIQEGELTAYRASLVNTNSISAVAESLGMNDYLLLSKGEAKDKGKARHAILANTFEAFLGALYLDQGYEKVQEFLGRVLMPNIDQIVKEKLWRDSKSYIQEKSQEIRGVTPFYEIIEEKGPDHDKHFTSGIYLGEELIAKGKGKSKQEAEQDAARKALETLGWE